MTALVTFFVRYGNAQEEEVAAITPDNGITVEAGQIKLPIRNPFVPKFPVTVEDQSPDDNNLVTEIEETTQAIVERTIEYVEPKITGLPNLYISGLIWDSERPQAIVNGNIIEVGDRMFKVPTDNKESIPEIKFIDISKEGLAVAYEDKIVIIKPELSKE